MYSSEYFKQPNDLQDALYKVQISGRQSQILNLIIRLTIGWQKTESRIANVQIAEMTGLRVNHVTREINCLVKRKIIFVGTGHCRIIKINTAYEQWIYKKPKLKRVISKMETTGKVKSLAMAIPKSRTVAKPTISKIEPVGTKIERVSSKMEPTAKPARKVTPAWFKELWRMYPAYRRGGNYSFGWKKWQSLGLTQDDASKAKEWISDAAKNDIAWAQDATSGFAFGLARFISESHWLTPVPVPQKHGHQTIDFSKVNYGKDMELYNEERAKENEFWKSKGM